LHLPFLLLLGFLFCILSGFLVKGVIAGISTASVSFAAAQQPLLVSAVACAGWAIVFFAGALLL
jgi:hypothetical protein